MSAGSRWRTVATLEAAAARPDALIENEGLSAGVVK
jgi:hypothetical protein